MQDAVHIFVDERVAIIILPTPVDEIHSHFTVNNRVLDISLMKIKKT
jgi:N-acetylmuramoyl-L-alanine amidase CwlA